MKDYSVLNEIRATVVEGMDDAYDEGYGKGYKDGMADGNINDGTFAEKIKEAYNNGMKDAWECIKQLEQVADCQLPNKTLCDIFGDDYYYGKTSLIIRKYSASEAIAKLKEYEEKQKQTDDDIKIGDEVNAHGFHRPVVVVALYDDSVKVMNSFGDTGAHLKTNVTKTGRHFSEIEELFKAMQEGKE